MFNTTMLLNFVLNASLPNSGNPELLEGDSLQLVVGDGRKGYAPNAPYHAIHVGAAAPDTPSELISQLIPGGRLLIPVGPQGGSQVYYNYLVNAFVGKSRLLSLF